MEEDYWTEVSHSTQPPRSASRNRSTQASRLAQEATLEDNYHEQAR